MNEKQIIIDGVDVSGCDFLAKEDDYCSYSGITYAYKGQCGCSDEEMCKEHPKCFYKKVLKQLKRKEQRIVELNKTIKAKEQECKELKKDVEYWKSNFNGKVSAIEELIKIIQQALKDFSIEVGTPQYDRLLNSAKSLGIEVDNGTNP